MNTHCELFGAEQTLFLFNPNNYENRSSWQLDNNFMPKFLYIQEICTNFAAQFNNRWYILTF